MQLKNGVLQTDGILVITKENDAAAIEQTSQVGKWGTQGSHTRLQKGTVKTVKESGQIEFWTIKIREGRSDPWSWFPDRNPRQELEAKVKEKIIPLGAWRISQLWKMSSAFLKTWRWKEHLLKRS